MENVLSVVFQDVQKALLTIPELRFTGENWGQLTLDQPPVNFPCALIDLFSVKYASCSRGTQTADATLTVTIADIMLTAITQGIPTQMQQRELAIFELLQKVNAVLHGKGGLQYSALTRESLQKVPQVDAVRQFVLSYRFSFTESTVSPMVKPSNIVPLLTVTQ